MPLPSRIAKYEIRRPIRQGGMGALYLGFDPELERPVAIKVLRDDFEGDDPRARFIREARAAAGLRHPNIVTIFDFGLDQGHPFIVMEYIPGETLAEVITRRIPLPLSRRLQIVEDLCGAVAHAHRMHIVHRDIKPGNVMFDPDGVVKVLDFGLARTPDSALTREGIVMGTLNYMSPEQLAGAPVDHRSDIFAVGTVLYELLAFKRAFGGGVSEGVIVKILHREPEPLPALSSGFDAELAGVVRRALRKHPPDRYQDLSAMRMDLFRIRTRLERADTMPLVRTAAAPGVPPQAGGAHAAMPRIGSVALLEEARDALSTSEFERAIAACDAAIEIDPDVGDAASTLRDHAERGRAVARASREVSTLESPAGVRQQAGLASSVPPVQSRPPATESKSRLRGKVSRRASVAALAVLSLSLAVAARGWLSAPDAAGAPAESTAATSPPAASRLPASRTIIPDVDVASATERRRAVSPPSKKIDTSGKAAASGSAATTLGRETGPSGAAPAPPVETAGAPSSLSAEPAAPTADAPVGERDPLRGRSLPIEGAIPRAAISPRTLSPEAPGDADHAPASLVAPSDAHLIEATLDRYAAAMSAMDMQALGLVLSMNEAARRRQASTFDKYTSLSVRLHPTAPPRVTGSTAIVRCRVEETVEVRGRSRRAGISQVDVSLQKSAGQWMVVGFVDR